MQIQEVLSLALDSGVPTLLWGKPGEGKTRSIEALCEMRGEKLVSITASNRDPTDFGGFPIRTDDGGYRLAPPGWAIKPFDVLFIDEMSCTPTMVQHALLRVILDRVIGDFKLPSHVKIVAAANPPEIASGWELTAPTANRFLHLDWMMDQDYWMNGMIVGWEKVISVKRADPNWEDDYLPQAKALVAAWIKHRPTALSQFPKDESKRGKAWPSPRTWDFASRALAVSWNEGLDFQIQLIAGCVGEGPASEFINWKKALDLPDPEMLLLNPDKFKLPSGQDRQYALTSSIVSAVVRKPTEKRWSAAWVVIEKVGEQGAKDIATAAAIQLARNIANDWPLPNAKFIQELATMAKLSRPRIKK